MSFIQRYCRLRPCKLKHVLLSNCLILTCFLKTSEEKKECLAFLINWKLKKIVFDENCDFVVIFKNKKRKDMFHVILHKQKCHTWKINLIDASMFQISSIIIFGKQHFIIREFSFVLWYFLNEIKQFSLHRYYMKDVTKIFLYSHSQSRYIINE